MIDMENDILSGFEYRIISMPVGIKSVRMPRCMVCEKVCSTQLYIFEKMKVRHHNLMCSRECVQEVVRSYKVIMDRCEKVIPL